MPVCHSASARMASANQSSLLLFLSLHPEVYSPTGANLSFSVQRGLSPGNKGRGEVRRGEESYSTGMWGVSGRGL